MLPLLRRWGQRFGGRPNRLVVVPGNGAASEALDNFAETVGVNPFSLVSNSVSSAVNVSISMVPAAALRAVSISLDRRQDGSTRIDRQRVVQHLAVLGDVVGPGVPPMLSEADAGRATDVRDAIVRGAADPGLVVCGRLDDVAAVRRTAIRPPTGSEILEALERMRDHVRHDEPDVAAAVSSAVVRLGSATG